MPCKGAKVQLAGGGAPPFLRSAHLECPSSVILVAVPALTGAGAIALALRRYAVGHGQPTAPPRYTASRQRFVTAASEARCHRVSRVGLNHTQALITFAYHRVTRILLRLRAYDRSDLS
jgi:hypothetical protein